MNFYLVDNESPIVVLHVRIYKTWGQFMYLVTLPKIKMITIHSKTKSEHQHQQLYWFNNYFPLPEEHKFSFFSSLSKNFTHS